MEHGAPMARSARSGGSRQGEPNPPPALVNGRRPLRQHYCYFKYFGRCVVRGAAERRSYTGGCDGWQRVGHPARVPLIRCPRAVTSFPTHPPHHHLHFSYTPPDEVDKYKSAFAKHQDAMKAAGPAGIPSRPPRAHVSAAPTGGPAAPLPTHLAHIGKSKVRPHL